MNKGHDWELTSVPKDLSRHLARQIGWKCRRCNRWATSHFGWSTEPNADSQVEIMVRRDDGKFNTYYGPCEEAQVVDVMDS